MTMTTKAPARVGTSGHCQTADQQPVPTAAHARCRLEGCACRCHTPAPRLKVSFACLTGAHDGCHGHGADVDRTPCGCPDAWHALHEGDTPWTATEPSHPLRDLEAATERIMAAGPDTLEPPGIQLTIPADDTDPHQWPAGYVPEDWKPARGLTQDERRRVIAAHLVHRPEAILETVAEIVAEREAGR